ncbi:hypothetical protein NC652_037276 [Populus alba x Populus x berolinensis]|nr:hypothetical protein NC652_037276 [Populus alba x Populus x berolinensis]
MGRRSVIHHLFLKCLIHQEYYLEWQMELVAVLMLLFLNRLNHGGQSIGGLCTPPL